MNSFRDRLFQFAAVLDVDLSGRYSVLTAERFDLLHNIVALDHLSEHRVLSVEPFGLTGGYEERSAWNGGNEFVRNGAALDDSRNLPFVSGPRLAILKTAS